MNDEQKQIEEMAKQMCGAIDNSCIHDCTPACGAREYAKRCFKAGYRKQSEVVKEFAGRLKERFEKTSTMATALHGRKESEITSIIDTVAAEYGVEVEEWNTKD